MTTDIVVFTDKLMRVMNAGITAANINEFGRFDTLKSYVDKAKAKAKAKAYFEESEGASFSAFQINIKIDRLLQDFIMNGGLDLKQPSTCTA